MVFLGDLYKGVKSVFVPVKDEKVIPQNLPVK
jgi:hypothetical protein